MASPLEPENTAAPNTPYYTPQQAPPAGTALSSAGPTPLLFTPLTIRGSTFPNRIFVAPMCMYSADNGKLTDFHLQHLGSFATRGAGLVMVEATAVTPQGRISPEDSGLWDDGQIAPIRKIATYIHSQGKHFSLQLAHAGRKASMCAPWLRAARGQSVLATRRIGGWPDDVVGPSAIAWDAYHAPVKALTADGIRETVRAFAAAAGRAVAAGVDSLEIHGAHGYLIHSFLSGATNRRTDAYGGSFDNRIRFLMEIIDAVRAVIPADMPLMLRVSGTDWLDPAEHPDTWTVDDTARLAKLLYARGVDLLDVSSGGNHAKQQLPPHTNEQIKLAGVVRKALNEEGGEAEKLIVTAVGGIAGGVQAEEILQSGTADGVFAARAFLRDAGFVLTCAEQLGVEAQWPRQYLRRGQMPSQYRGLGA